MAFSQYNKQPKNAQQHAYIPQDIPGLVYPARSKKLGDQKKQKKKKRKKEKLEDGTDQTTVVEQKTESKKVETVDQTESKKEEKIEEQKQKEITLGGPKKVYSFMNRKKGSDISYKKSRFESLPEEIIVIIMDFLKQPRDLAVAMRLSKTFLKIATKYRVWNRRELICFYR